MTMTTIRRDGQGREGEEDEGVLVFARCSPSTCNIATSNTSSATSKTGRGRRRRNGSGNGRRPLPGPFGPQAEDDEAEDEDDGDDSGTHDEDGGIEYGGGGSRRSLGLGSGIIWDDDGHIVTNNHVVNGSNVQLVTLHDGSRYNAKEVG